VAQIDHFFVCKAQTLDTKNFSLCTIFTAAWANPSLGGARGCWGEFARCLGQAGEPPDKPCHRRQRSEQASHHCALPSSHRGHPRTTLGVSPPRAARRWRPRQEKLAVATGLPHWSRRPWCRRSACCAAAGRSYCEPSIVWSIAEIRTWNTPSSGLISASHPTIDDHCLMRIHRPREPAPWTRSTMP
jgi:hypothetical protein